MKGYFLYIIDWQRRKKTKWQERERQEQWQKKIEVRFHEVLSTLSCAVSQYTNLRETWKDTNRLEISELSCQIQKFKATLVTTKLGESVLVGGCGKETGSKFLPSTGPKR